jgi:hypothetical protein
MLNRFAALVFAVIITAGMGLGFVLAQTSDTKKEEPKKTEEKSIKNSSDALQDQVFDNKRQLLITQYNDRIKDFRATPQMQALEQQINDVAKKQNDLRIKMLKELGVDEEDFNRWKFDSENAKVIKMTDEEFNQLQQQQQRPQ